MKTTKKGTAAERINAGVSYRLKINFMRFARSISGKGLTAVIRGRIAALAAGAALLVFCCASCGARLNDSVGGAGKNNYDTVLPGAGNADAEAEKAETAPVTKYNPYFEVAVKETASGILYLPVTDEDGAQTSDILVVGYNGVSFDVKIPAIIDGGNVRYIGEGAFYGKGNISSITLPDSVIEIGRAAFSACPNLTAVTFGDGLTELPAALFRNCKVLSAVKLPASLVSIGDFAFENCIRLESLYIPASVTEIGHDAFMTCERLTLDISDNAYAAGYAKEYKINTDGFFSYSAQRARILAGVAVGAAAAAVAVVVPFYLRRKKEKRA